MPGVVYISVGEKVMRILGTVYYLGILVSIAVFIGFLVIGTMVAGPDWLYGTDTVVCVASLGMAWVVLGLYVLAISSIFRAKSPLQAVVNSLLVGIVVMLHVGYAWSVIPFNFLARLPFNGFPWAGGILQPFLVVIGLIVGVKAAQGYMD